MRSRKTEDVEYDPVSLNDLEIHAEGNDNLERHEVSKIEDRVQCQKCLRYSRPGESSCGCGRMLQGIMDEVMKQAEQGIQSIHHVRCWHSRFSIEEYPKGADAMENLKNRKNSNE